MKREVIIWGAGGHAKVVADILMKIGYVIWGLIDEHDALPRKASFAETSVLGDATELPKARAAGVCYGIVGFGNNFRRMSATEVLGSLGFTVVKAIHPSAVLAMDTTVGVGSTIAAGVVIGPSTLIGKSVIVNTRASIDHDCVFDDGAQAGPGVSIAGHVKVGSAAFIGIGATVIERKRIGAGAIVAAGSVVIDDVPEGVLVAGVPARIIRPVNAA